MRINIAQHQWLFNFSTDAMYVRSKAMRSILLGTQGITFSINYLVTLRYKLYGVQEHKVEMSEDVMKTSLYIE